MAAQMDSQIEGAICENERLNRELDQLKACNRELLEALERMNNGQGE